MYSTSTVFGFGFISNTRCVKVGNILSASFLFQSSGLYSTLAAAPGAYGTAVGNVTVHTKKNIGVQRPILNHISGAVAGVMESSHANHDSNVVGFMDINFEATVGLSSVIGVGPLTGAYHNANAGPPGVGAAVGQ